MEDKKYFEIIHCEYGDVCSDPFFGKKGNIVSDDIVFDTEEAVKQAVKTLNQRNHSFFPKDEPDDWHDEDWMDYDYFYYIEVKPMSLEEVIELRGWRK